MKKLIALTLATVMLLALCACGGNSVNSGNAGSGDIPEGKAIADDAVLNVTITSHASWPYEESWKVWEYIKEEVGGTVNITAVPIADFGTKFPLIMADRENFPDVLAIHNQPSSFSSYCTQGAFVPFDDYPEIMTDYNAFWESVSEEEREMQKFRTHLDGKIYRTPIYGMERQKNVRCWLYRKDIFDKHNLKVPETIDEVYEVSKKLKELYPESYPFCVRTGFDNMCLIGPSFKEYFYHTLYYDFNNDKWSYGATEDVMKDIVLFYNKMVAEGLTPANLFTIKAAEWQELITTDRGFIMADYQTRIDFFNSMARTKNPGFNLTAMVPPKANTPTATNKVNKYNVDPTGAMVLNTGDESRIENAMRYVNWFYSDEGTEIVSWGKEGETYEIVDGKKKFIVEEGSSAILQYGFQTIGSYFRIDPDAADAASSDEQVATTDMILENTVAYYNPARWVSLTDEEATLAADYNTSIASFVTENLTKFIIGQRPMSEWDAFKAELLELPVDELLAVYEAAYNRIK